MIASSIVLALLIIASAVFRLRRRGPAAPSVTADGVNPAPEINGWLERGEPLMIAGLPVGGMIHVGTPPAEGVATASWIDPTLPVARTQPDIAGQGLPEWPRYADLSPAARSAYLRWLATGREDRAFGIGYALLYFQGLERRFFVDDDTSEAERETILDEALRLRGVVEHSPMARIALDRFIDAGRVVLCRPDLVEPPAGAGEFGLPLALKVPVGAMIMDGITLTHEWLFSWWSCDRDRKLRTAATRCPADFRALFGLRFVERFPEGLRVRLLWKELRPVYRSAAGAFEHPIDLDAYGGPFPDIADLRDPPTVAQEIADGAMDELERLSRFLGQNPAARGSIIAYAFLPAGLRPYHASRESELFLAWARERVGAGGHALLGDLLFRLDGGRAVPSEPERLVDVADALTHLGFGISPDPRKSAGPLDPGELITLSSLGHGAAVERDIATDADGGRLVPLGSAIARAMAAPSERAKPAADTPRGGDTRGRGTGERRTAGPAAPAGVEFRAPAGEARRASGIVGLDWTEVRRRMEAIRKARGRHPVSLDGPPSTPPPGASSDAPSATSAGPRPARAIDPSRLAGLDPATARLAAELVRREHWSELEFEALARRHRVAPGGVCQSLNAWSDKNFGEAIIEKDGDYAVNAAVVDRLAPAEADDGAGGQDPRDEDTFASTGAIPGRNRGLSASGRLTGW
ncbi:TerB N-terminal domain-containing protein [Amaricoccus sp. W119]|uniref:TerB N-terminal domain-containing protein n=1 Tax=Amaricoccus sp. W119 TaxID=3391833 RepID=UPI0039A718DB